MAPVQAKPDTGDPAGGSDAQAIKEVLTDVQADFPLLKGVHVCRDLSREMRRELRRSRLASSGKCDDGVVELALRNRAAGIDPLYSKVISIDVDGGRASAVVHDPGRPPRAVPFVRKGAGAWKLASLQAVEPISRHLGR